MATEAQPSPKARVIITSGTSILALIIAHSLGKYNLEIVGAGCVEHTPLFFSKYTFANEVHEDPAVDEERFLQDLERIIVKYRPENDVHYVLMPSFKETVVVANNKERFPAYITIACPDSECITSVYPKNRLAESLSNLDVHAPKTRSAESEEELEQIENEFGYPILIKPYNESGGRGIHKLANREELNKAFDEHINLYNEPALFQEVIDGEDYCFTGIFDRGKLKASMAYKNLRRFPVKSGSSVMRETIDDTPFRDIAESLLGPLQWNGVAQVDFMWTGKREDKPYLIEVNPRFWAGLYQSIQAGVDYPWLNLLLFTNNELPENIEVTLGNKTKLPGTWVLSSIQESLNLEEGFKTFADAVKLAFGEILIGKPLTALKTFVGGISAGFDPAESLRRLIDSLEEGSEAEREVKMEKDPYIILGSLYIAEYFLKYKKLPPQLDF